MTTLSVQLYSLGDAPTADPGAVAERLATLGYEAVEPVVSTGVSDAMKAWAASMGLGEMGTVDTAALKRALDEHGLRVASCHAQLPEGEHAEAILDEQEMLGCSLLIVPAMFDDDAGQLEAFDDLDRIRRLAERFNVAADRARSRGIHIGYHNHFWELSATVEGRSGLEAFYDYTEPDVVAEIDVYWAQAGGRDPVDLVRSLGDRVLLLHVKDGDGELGSPSTPLGSGVVDVAGVLDAATAAVAHVVELEGLDEQAVWPVLEQCQQYLTAGR